MRAETTLAILISVLLIGYGIAEYVGWMRRDHMRRLNRLRKRNLA